jgi:glucosamine-phosphate N-acetyltransferase
MTIEEAAIGNTNLFDRSEFISEQVQSTLPPRYLIRPLDRNDDQHGFIELLSQLSVVGNFTPELFKSRV